jgi:hypothetical protein
MCNFGEIFALIGKLANSARAQRWASPSCLGGVTNRVAGGRRANICVHLNYRVQITAKVVRGGLIFMHSALGRQGPENLSRYP